MLDGTTFRGLLRSGQSRILIADAFKIASERPLTKTRTCAIDPAAREDCPDRTFGNRVRPFIDHHRNAAVNLGMVRQDEM